MTCERSCNDRNVQSDEVQSPVTYVVQYTKMAVGSRFSANGVHIADCWTRSIRSTTSQAYAHQNACSTRRYEKRNTSTSSSAISGRSGHAKEIRIEVTHTHLGHQVHYHCHLITHDCPQACPIYSLDVSLYPPYTHDRTRVKASMPSLTQCTTVTKSDRQSVIF